jgi:hypothetical protein
MQPYLSVVAASRNDDHGGDPLHRTQIFINCFAQQCDKHRLPAEMILVDWNPVADRPGLASVLQLPTGSQYCSARVITVPASLHNSIKYGDRLAFFQMIAKNVAIRRARGAFVVATNIDIVFSDELVAFLAKQTLDPHRMYRVDRYDIKTDLSTGVGVDIVLDKAWRSIIRTNRRANLQEFLDPIYGHDAACRDCTPNIMPGQHQSEKIALVMDDGHWQLRPHPGSPIEHLNTNACGDFTLLSKSGWAEIRGYPDFEAFSFNIDSMGLVMAHYHGLHETSLLPPCVCFHIEHGLGSGYTPEGEQKLFDRIRVKRILSPDWPVLNPWVEQMRSNQRSLPFNRDDWGLADYDLPEQPLGSRPTPEWQRLTASVVPLAGSVGSLRPEYDLDSVTLFHEREARQPDVCAREPVAAPVTVSPLMARPMVERSNVLFDHPHDSHCLLDHFQSRLKQNERPLVVRGAPSLVEHVHALLAPRGGGPILSDLPVSGSGSGSDRKDTLLLATEPQQMILDLHKYGLLVPRDDEADLVIWVRDSSPTVSHERRWMSSVKLARRLLAAVRWRVTVVSQTELA